MSIQSTTETTPIYLTKVTVPLKTALGKLRVKDAYDWHKRVWDLFGDRDGVTRDFLMRIDRKEASFQVLVLSQAEAEKPSWCPANCFESKAIPDSFFNHTRFRFSLMANPTKKIAALNSDGTKKKNGKRIPVTKREELVKWLKRKADDGGFQFEPQHLQSIPRGREVFHKKGSPSGTLNAIEFVGDLTVVDISKFRSALSNGIGTAKAFGFGLLLLSPIK